LIYIAHRGNLAGPNPEKENHPDYIKKALTIGYNVEVDVHHREGKWWLGHDGPTYQVDKDFFYNNMLWCHAKNLEALQQLAVLGVHYFWHQTDDVALTSRGYFWTYPGKELTNKSIAVMPEKTDGDNFTNCAGICTDLVLEYAHNGELK
tara:strand:- start:62 stop:508 length:447 start_codon:yes stop_codon:yes gene_type:complete